MWNFVFCEGKKFLRLRPFGWDYKVKPPNDFLDTTQPPYIVVPTGSKDIVMLYARVKTASPPAPTTPSVPTPPPPPEQTEIKK